MRLFRWESAPAGYAVAFSTRLGGVSEGRYRSLNLGVLTGDEPDRVVVNRRRVCDAVGADAETATMALQVHGARVTEAAPLGVLAPGTPYEPCDGLWSDRPGQAMLLVTADCVPVALARENGPRGLAVLHVGWRGLLAGIVENGVAALRDGRSGNGRDGYLDGIAAAIGPAIGPCCYEVGDEVAGAYRERFGAAVLQGRNLDLPEATARALRAAGVRTIDETRRCTACEADLFFSHRRDRGRTGRQGVVAVIR
ncbi:MAG: polyphenol oxidase family protein [Actinomycetota bacterium]|nr:polyphenol oxidase family protein [Actinomycetota bacterium]